MTCPNKEVLLNYIVCAFLILNIIATLSAHHNIDTLTAVGKMDILWSTLSLSLSLSVQLSDLLLFLLHSVRMFSVRLYLLNSYWSI